MDSEEENDPEGPVGTGRESGALSANNDDSEAVKANGEKKLDPAGESAGALDQGPALEPMPT
jgi:hypothetical protein